MQVATGKSILNGIAIGSLRIYRKTWVQTGQTSTLTETFLQMGLDELSVFPSAVLPLRKLIRSLDLTKELEI